MSNKFIDYKQALANFFDEKGYLTYGKSATKKITYLYSKDAKFPVIKLAIVNKVPTNKADHELDYLKQQVAQITETNLSAIPTLEIYLSAKFENNFVKNDNSIIIITNSWDYLVHSLSIDFPQIANLEDPEISASNSSAKMTSGDFNLDDIKSADDLKKRLGALSLQLKNGNSTATMIISLLFLIVPFIISLASAFVLGIGLPTSVGSLVFGGTTYTLTFLGGQWWRIFTYGFGAGADIINIIFLIIFAWVGFRRLRLNELMMGTWKMLGVFLMAYLVTGFFLSVLSGGVASGADGIAFAIVIGMIALNTGGSKSALATTAKSQNITPILVIIFFILAQSFSGQSSSDSIMSLVIAFIAGGSFSFMVTYDYKELNWRLGVGIVLILALILVPVAMLIVPTYLPGVDLNVVQSLGVYIRLNFMSVDQANSIIDKIGWDNINWNNINNIMWITIR